MDAGFHLFISGELVLVSRTIRSRKGTPLVCFYKLDGSNANGVGQFPVLIVVAETFGTFIPLAALTAEITIPLKSLRALQTSKKNARR